MLLDFSNAAENLACLVATVRHDQRSKLCASKGNGNFGKSRPIGRLKATKCRSENAQSVENAAV
jgi:hypothetical protein